MFLRLRLHGHNTLPRYGATNHSNVTRTDFAMTRPRYDAMKPCILYSEPGRRAVETECYDLRMSTTVASSYRRKSVIVK